MTALNSLQALGVFGLGQTELIIILVIVVLIFGGKKLPELGRSVGLGIKNFKKGVKGAGDDDEEVEEDAKPLTADADAKDVDVVSEKAKKREV